MIYTTTSIINGILLDDDHGARNLSELQDYPWAFCVHSSIIEIWEKILKNWPTKLYWDIYEHKIQIGARTIDMRLINVTPMSDEILTFIRKSIRNSQLSFPWEDSPTLFVNVERFNLLEQFIKRYNLQQHIIKIEEKPGIKSKNDVLKVVTFNQSVNSLLDITEEFAKYLYPNIITISYRKQLYYYMTYALPWLQPHFLKEIAVDDKFYSAFFIILIHLERIKYELNIMDLISIRLALNDFRKPSPSRPVINQIDFTIKRELSKIIQYNHLLDIHEYLFAKNYEQNGFLINYLVYEFQNFFENIYLNSYNGHPSVTESNKVWGTITLADETNILGAVKSKSNACEIDGSGYDQMSSLLFLDLLECPNVRSFHLDTNYRWLNEEGGCDLSRFIPKRQVSIYLIGPNTYNFIEDFVMSFKKIEPSNEDFTLYIYCRLNDYTILNDLSAVQTIFLGNIFIDTEMLEGFFKSDYTSKVCFTKCTLENTRHNWSLLHNLRDLRIVQIKEDEVIWQTIFEFIVDEMDKRNSKEFQFETKIFISIGYNSVALNKYKFLFDETHSKLEIFNTQTNQFVDLFQIKFRLQPEDTKSDYDFYQ